MDDKLDTGVAGLDAALVGGFPRGNLVLLSGGAGTGKSTFCLHFLLAGAARGEKGVYVTTEQDEAELEKQAGRYSMPLRQFVSEGVIKIVYVDVLKDEQIVGRLVNEVRSFGASRAVIDSLSTFSEFSSASEIARDILLTRGGVATRNVDLIVPQNVTEKTMVKRMLGLLISTFKSLGVTMLLTSELPEKGEALSSDGVSEFLVDGVLVLQHLGVGLSQFRSLQVRKMRYSMHSNEVFGYDFRQHGIEFVENAV